MDISVRTLDKEGKKVRLQTSIAERLPHILRQLELNNKEGQYLLDCSSTTLANYLHGTAKTVSWLAVSRLCQLDPMVLPYLCGDVSTVSVDRSKLNRVLRGI